MVDYTLYMHIYIYYIIRRRDIRLASYRIAIVILDYKWLSALCLSLSSTSLSLVLSLCKSLVPSQSRLFVTHVYVMVNYEHIPRYIIITLKHEILGERVGEWMSE